MPSLNLHMLSLTDYLMRVPSPRNSSRARRAFTMITVIVMLGMVAVVAVIAIPLLVQANRFSRVQRTADFLERVRIAYHDPAPLDDSVRAWRQRIPRSPGRISQLTNPIFSGDATNYMDSCRGNYLNAHATAWTNFGPFATGVIDPAIGLVTPIGISNNDLVRNPPTGGGAGTLAIVFPNVDIADALLLDAVADTATGFGAGAVRWTDPPVAGLTTMSYLMQMIAGC